MDNFTNNIVDIQTKGGYTLDQILNNKNCSKDPSYWYLIEHTKDTDSPKYLFKSDIAESWEFFDPDISNPIRNTNQIYLRFSDVSKFVEPSNYYRKHGEYPFIRVPDTLEYNKYWDDLEDKIDNGFEYKGVRITGRHFFIINFGRFRAIPVDEFGKATSTRKIWTFLKFLDHQYYMMHELEECFLEGVYNDKESFLEWFPEKNELDFELLKLQNFAISKGRRKGWTAAIGIGGVSYNFTFRESSNNIIAAYEKGKYGPVLRAVQNTKAFLDINTPWKRRTDIKGTYDHFISGVEVTDEYGIKSKIGYESEVKAVSFKDAPFKSVGETADLIDIEEAGIFQNLIQSYQVSMEPLIRDGETMIGVCIIGGCVCKGTKVYDKDGKVINIENVTKESGILSYNGSKVVKENVSWIQPVSKKRCYRIITSNGKYIDCSYDHPLLWSKNRFAFFKEMKKTKAVTMKRAEHIRVGDQLMVVPNLELFGDKKMWNPRFIGLMIGDGNYGGCGGDQFYIGDEDIYNWLQSQNISFKVSNSFKTKKGTIFRKIGLSGIRNHFRELGIYGQTKQNKHLPKDVHLYDKKSISELIGGYFDADGNVNYNVKKNTIRVRLTSKYKHLLEEVQHLLYKFNIDSIIEERYSKKGYKPGKSYNLVISKYKDVINFKNNISFICSHKQKILDSISIKNKKTRHSYAKCKFILNEDNNKGYYFYGKDIHELRSVFVKEIIDLGEQEVYNITADNTHTYLTNGFLSCNTSGDMESGASQGLSDIMHNPRAYGFKAYQHIYEQQELNSESGWFIDDLWYLPKKIRKEELLTLDSSERTKRILDKFDSEYVETVDIYGNSYRYLANIILEAKREDKRKISTLAYQKFITQQPKYLSEAFLLNESSPFDTATAKEVLGELSIKKPDYKKGVFSLLQGKPTFRLNMDLVDIDLYNFKGYDTTGCWVIYDDPIKINGEIPTWRYISATDPIDYGTEESSNEGTHSMAATYIIDTITRNIVAEYIGRPRKADDYFEQLWRGIEYYNAYLLYENNLKALFSYFKLKNKLNLLAREPESLKSRSGYKANNRAYGFHATAASNSYARELIHTWTLENVLVSTSDDGTPIYVPRIYYIKSRGLLEEIIYWNSKGNFDRISALGAAMILLFDRTYEEDDIINTNSIMDEGIFVKMRNMINKQNKFNFR